jgi:glucose/arabinose dehydrogenase
MKIITKYLPFLALIFFAVCCNNSAKDNSASVDTAAITNSSASLPLSSIKLPKGFSISVYAEVENARSLALSPNGTLFVSNKDEDKVYAVKDMNGDGVADKKWILATGLNMPNGVAFKDGDLYIAEISKILKIKSVESKLDNPGKPEVIYDQYPTDAHHGWKYIAFGPDGKLYVPVGAPCNICDNEEKKPVYASITRINANGTGMEVFAKGVRNTVGFTWHPVTKNIWFTDNGRDMLGDDIPPCELNTATKEGQHFGYPYCHGGIVKDPEFGNKRACADFVQPAQNLGAHVAPLGLKFYTGDMFPTQYKNQIILAEHGSWNRSKKSGYKLSLVKVDENNKTTAYETFASGWLDEATQKAWGRPVDVLMLSDGSLLVSDDQAGVVYRITYKA